MISFASFFSSLPRLTVAAAGGASFWMPEQASSSAPQVDSLFDFVYCVSLFFFILIVGVMIFMVVRYHKRPGHGPQPASDHSNTLEITWSFIPLCLVLVMFYLGFQQYLDARTPPDKGMEIQVIGRQWSWQFNYPNGYESVRLDDDHPPELHVPPNEPVRLLLSSQDVIHGLFIPDFRLKMDVVPGRFNKAWFTATKPGTYQIFCTVYCGTAHSEMRGWCVVHEDYASFMDWLGKAKEKVEKGLTPVERGKRIFMGKGSCSSCHSVEEKVVIGPSFKDLFGSTVQLSNGTAVTADENYLRESLLDPGAKIVAGFQNQMPTQQGRLREREVGDVIEFIKAQSKNYHPMPAAPETAPAEKPVSGGVPATSEQKKEPEHAR